MARKSKLLERVTGLLVLCAFLAMAIPPAVVANAQEPAPPKVYEFPTKAYSGVYGQQYQINELRMLNAMSKNGAIPINKGQTIDCVSLIGDLDTVDNSFTGNGSDSLDPSEGYYELANYAGVDTKGTGACDVCSWIYYVLDQEGFNEAAGHVHKPHKKLPGVPESHSVSIWSTDPTQNIWMTNETGYDAILRWQIDDAKDKVKFWLENAANPSQNPPSQPMVTYQPATYDTLPFVVDQRVESAAWFADKQDLMACHDMSVKPDMIVLHEALISSLGSQTPEYAEGLDGAWYASQFKTRLNNENNPAAGTWNRNGYHFIVSYRQDASLEYVPVYITQNLDCMSWGVGSDVNSHAIQIGIVGYPPHEAGDPKKFPNQYRTTLALVRVLMDQFGIAASNVKAHVEVGTHSDPEAINPDQFRSEVQQMAPITNRPSIQMRPSSSKTVKTAKTSVVVLLVVIAIGVITLSILKVKNPAAYLATMKTMKMVGLFVWHTMLYFDEFFIGLTGRQRRMQMKAIRTGLFAGLFMTCCVFTASLFFVMGDRGIKPQTIVTRSASMMLDASPMLDNWLSYALGEGPVTSFVSLNTTTTATMPRFNSETTYIGVYGAINGWGSLGEATDAVSAIRKAFAYAEAAKSWRTRNIVPVVNLRYASDAVIESISDLCTGKCIVMVDITPNQDVSGIIQRLTPNRENIWFDIDLEHRGVSTPASEFNGWANEYFTIRQNAGYTSLGVFAFYDFRSDPWLTPPSEVVWSYNGGNGLVVPIFDGHCSGAPCKDSKFSATQKVLSNYAQAQATGIMEFTTKWGCGSQYGDCGFTNQQYWEEFKPLLFMSQ